jgi:hypothetical protein
MLPSAYVMPTPSVRANRGLRELPYIAVLVVAGIGLVYAVIFHDHWLRGVGVVGAALIGGGLLRASLTDAQAGLLVVRQRSVDVTCYFLLGGAIIGVGLVLPH